MEILFATPTGARVGKSTPQPIDVLFDSSAHTCRELYGDEDTPLIVRSASAGSADILSAGFEFVKLGSQEI
jgi:hypothetical protein